jgi:hypothetical protein
MLEHPDFGDICECKCHWDSHQVLHFDACCQFCYKKYVDTEGTIDIKRYGILIMDMRLTAQGK